MPARKQKNEIITIAVNIPYILYMPRMGKNENSLFLILGMKALALFQEGHHTAKGENGRGNHEGYNKTDGNIADNESYNGTACRPCGPVDVASLKTQKFKGTLKPLEYWIIGVKIIHLFHDAILETGYSIPKNRGRA